MWGPQAPRWVALWLCTHLFDFSHTQTPFNSLSYGNLTVLSDNCQVIVKKGELSVRVDQGLFYCVPMCVWLSHVLAVVMRARERRVHDSCSYHTGVHVLAATLTCACSYRTGVLVCSLCLCVCVCACVRGRMLCRLICIHGPFYCTV